MHLAAFTRVGESVKYPDKYRVNNFEKAKIFIDTCLNNNLKRFIFSSTGSVYGNLNKNINIKESDPTNPINPYSQSKLDFEKYLLEQTSKKAYCTILRYFNVAGADLKKRSGLKSNPDNLIKAICEVAVKKRDKLTVNGNDYETKDGTPIRDFIHVLDLAEIHILVAKSLMNLGENEIYNCGYGKGFSIMDVIKEVNSIIGFQLPIKIGSRRKGDAIYSVADNQRFLQKFKWIPKYDNLKIILESSLNGKKLKILMSNIIITPAIGMPANDITLFIASLRKFYNGEVLFFVGKNDYELKKILNIMGLHMKKLNHTKMKL